MKKNKKTKIRKEQIIAMIFLLIMVTIWLMMVGTARVATALGTGIFSNKYFSASSSIASIASFQKRKADPAQKVGACRYDKQAG